MTTTPQRSAGGSGSANRIRFRRDSGLLHLTLCAPERGNTIDRAFTAELAAALADLRDVRCILITADGPNFCLGGDITGFAAAHDPGEYLNVLAGEFHASLVRLDQAGVPVVVGAQGWAAGAGMSLLLAADIVVLERTAKLRTAYTAIGFTPDGGMTWTLPRAVGTARALDLLLTNRPMDAEEALAAGIASRVVDDGAAAATVLEIARGIADGPFEALSATRNLVRSGRFTTYAAQLDAERARISAQAGSPEGREGVAAFLARRVARWRDQ